MCNPMVYCDHNFVIAAHDAGNEYHDHLRDLASTNRLKFVLSTWHWLELARDNNAARGLSVAAFADSLTPLWFFERRNVQRREVEYKFFVSLGLSPTPPSMIGSLAEAIADLTGATLHIASKYRDSRAFVQYMQTLDGNHPINLSIRDGFEKQRQNGEAYRAGRITDEMLRCLDKILIGGLLPGQTPAGAAIDRATKDKFLLSCNNNDFPCWAVESALSLDGWQTGRILNDRAFRDSQHVIALPYVDIFITDDGQLTAAIQRVAATLPFRTAEVITRAEFDTRFQ
jgi:hypothetical protein